MSAEWQVQGAESWKITLPCTRAEGEAVAALGELEGFDPAPVVMASEPDQARPEEWRIDAYVEGAPTPALAAAICALAPSFAGEPAIERVEDRDWVTESQRWLEPIRAGRFFVHTAAHADAVPQDAIAFHIEAGRAFGTGHHETTAGCLEALDAMAGEGFMPAHIADVGTGTGLLAFAARALWPDAAVTASDIDPVAMDVTAENMAANGIAPHAITLAVADGLSHPALRRSGGFALVIANILAGPLIEMAPDIVKATQEDGRILLAGLLASQAEAVLEAYAREGAQALARLDRGDWSILTLVHRAYRQAGPAAITM